ncbi:FecR family protein [Longitalea arenae]|uniref:FecR family protein n=1 Tax=Longitalea arenae TaxID=2812558 RepID=UPI001968541C|nr:FecR family protein [Longitalea arenae]
MALSKEELDDLYNKYIQNQCSPQELEMLVNELGAVDEANEEAITQLFNTTWDGLEVHPDKYSLPNLALPGTHAYETPVIGMYSLKRRWMRIAVAASIILITGAAGFWLIRTRETKLPTRPVTIKKDVSPGGNKAILTLADNSTIVLDNAANGKLAQQGVATISKSGDGSLAYSLPANREGNSEPLYNTLRTPRGGQYQLTLSDGTKVWLNAASSVTYPTSFTGDERKVSISGEVYLEVARNASKPFKVQTNGAEIQVLGTHFNVHAYEDEPAKKITLIEGKVKVSSRQPATGKAASVILKPGQQAIAAGDAPLTIDHSPDIEEVLAWKNGLFRFNNADIKTVMKQVERWYDVEVVYEGPVPEGHFRGKIPRNVMASEMLKIIEASGIEFRIENKKIIITK